MSRYDGAGLVESGVNRRVGSHLAWDGVFNARDLGGIRTAGGIVRRGAVVRSDALDALTARGWRAVLDHGIRTVIDLRHDDERAADVPARPSAIATLTMPVGTFPREDAATWDAFRDGWQLGTPLVYVAHVERFPKVTAAVIRAIADAPPGGVVVHCAAGRDRTGLVTMLLLSLLAANEDDMTADYLASRERLRAMAAHKKMGDAGTKIDRFLEGKGTTLDAAFRDAARAVDMDAWAREGGLDAPTIAKLQTRLLAAGQ